MTKKTPKKSPKAKARAKARAKAKAKQPLPEMILPPQLEVPEEEATTKEKKTRKPRQRRSRKKIDENGQVVYLDSKEQLLITGIQVYAEHGYQDALIQEICDRSSANSCLVYYYFEDKAGHYSACWRYALEISEKRFPLFYRDGKQHSPEQRLRYFIRNRLQQARFKSLESCFARILQHEITCPTHCYADIQREVLRPRLQQIRVFLKDLLGPKCTDEQINFCRYTLFSQCAMVQLDPAPRERLLGEMTTTKKNVQLERLTEHIYQFMLAGIEQMRSGKA